MDRKFKYDWVAHYRCGCVAEEERKSDLLEYCATHGHDLQEPIQKWPKDMSMFSETEEDDGQTSTLR